MSKGHKNLVMLIGNVGSDPELRYGQGENPKAFCNFSLATTEGDGAKEHTEWHRVVTFGKQAEACGKYMSKGMKVFVEGKLQTNSYVDKSGVKKYNTSVIAQSVNFLSPSKKGEVAGEQSSGEPQQTRNLMKEIKSTENEKSSYDDIPF